MVGCQNPDLWREKQPELTARQFFVGQLHLVPCNASQCVQEISTNKDVAGDDLIIVQVAQNFINFEITSNCPTNCFRERAEKIRRPSAVKR